MLSDSRQLKLPALPEVGNHCSQVFSLTKNFVREIGG
jgi:hypothetical protein